MKLNKPFLSKLNIVIIVILLITGVISLFVNIILKKENLLSVTDNNLCTFIKENDKLNTFLTDKKIPVETLDYMNKDECKNAAVKMYDNIYNNESFIVDETDIRDLIKLSILDYESTTNEDIYSYIEEELLEVSKEIKESIDTNKIYEEITFLTEATNYYWLSFVIIIVSTILLIIYEKNYSALILGLTFSLTSLISNYILLEIPNIVKRNLTIIKLFNIDLYSISKSIAGSICSIIFLVGLVFFSIYIIIMFKKLYTQARIAYLDKYY